MLRNGSSDETSFTETSSRQRATAFDDDVGATSHSLPSGTAPFGDAGMASLIEDEIIPKLIAAHRISGIAQRPELEHVTESLLDGLAPDLIADSALDREPEALMDLVDQALAKGLTPESLLVDVLAPAARCLGSRWDNDTADFIDVTMGLWRMQEIVHELAARRPDELARRVSEPSERTARRIMFAVAPGDSHSFGSVMLEEMFQRAGWSTRSCRDGAIEDLRSEARAHWFDVIALTISIEQHSGAIANLVAALRHSSRNPNVRIMVGGKIFTDLPGLADEVGADATASDARAAIEKADLLVEQATIDCLASQATGHASGLGSASGYALRRSAPG